MKFHNFWPLLEKLFGSPGKKKLNWPPWKKSFRCPWTARTDWVLFMTWEWQGLVDTVSKGSCFVTMLGDAGTTRPNYCIRYERYVSAADGCMGCKTGWRKCKSQIMPSNFCAPF